MLTASNPKYSYIAIEEWYRHSALGVNANAFSFAFPLVLYSVGYGITSTPSRSKKATDLGIWNADVTRITLSKLRCRQICFTYSAFSAVFRLRSSFIKYRSSTPQAFKKRYRYNIQQLSSVFCHFLSAGNPNRSTVSFTPRHHPQH